MFDKNLPNIGTPAQALEKMKDGYKSFLDAAAKFVTITQFYVEKSNVGQPLPSDFQSKYTVNYQKLKKETPENVCYLIASFTVLELDFVEEIKDNLTSYQDMITNGPDKDASDYDKACDYLAIRDEFIDLKTDLVDVAMTIGSDREAYTNYNDPEYDYNAKQLEESKFGN